jgi:hypothetical protein
MVDELYDPLRAHYEADPDVTVIIDRRESERRGPNSAKGGSRELRDRRRRRPGSLPTLVKGD